MILAIRCKRKTAWLYNYADLTTRNVPFVMQNTFTTFSGQHNTIRPRRRHSDFKYSCISIKSHHCGRSLLLEHLCAPSLKTRVWLGTDRIIRGRSLFLETKLFQWIIVWPWGLRFDVWNHLVHVYSTHFRIISATHCWFYSRCLYFNTFFMNNIFFAS